MSKGESFQRQLADHARMKAKHGRQAVNIDHKLQALSLETQLQPLGHNVEHVSTRVEFNPPVITEQNWSAEFSDMNRTRGDETEHMNQSRLNIPLFQPEYVPNRPMVRPMLNPSRILSNNYLPQTLIAKHEFTTHNQGDEWQQEFEKKQRELSETKSRVIVAEDQNDLLSKTAARIADIMDSDRSGNEKFQKSNFLKMMKSFRDKELVVEKDKVVQPLRALTDDNPGIVVPSPFEMAQKFANSKLNWDESPLIEQSPGILMKNETHRINIDPMHASNISHDMDDLENFRGFKRKEPIWFEQHNVINTQLDYDSIIEKDQYEPKAEEISDQAIYNQYVDIENSLLNINEKTKAHEALFESPVKSREILEYTFSSSNPFSEFSEQSLKNIHSPDNLTESILIKEALLKRNPPDSHVLWYELGKLQQENENESASISALTKAIDINPDFLESYIPLAISYANENYLGAAYSSIATWLSKHHTYKNIFDLKSAKAEGDIERHEFLISVLLSAASSNPGETLDPEVQTALGVLFNISSDFEKAVDCFQAALSTSPRDYSLWNRLGATLANAGQSERALDAYFKALEINPNYLRTRYNLSIACMHMGQLTVGNFK